MITEWKRHEIAKQMIIEAEDVLGVLTDGQRRDLLLDNTLWSSLAVRCLVHTIGHELPN